MNLRLKLIVSFSLSAFVALFLFGLVAYDTALEESEKNESRLIFSILEKDLNSVVDILSRSEDSTEQLKEFDSSSDLAFYIYDNNNKPVYLSPEMLKLEKETMQQFNQKEVTGGEFHLNDTEFHWYRMPLESSRYSVVAAYTHGPETENSFFVQMALSLAVTAFIVVWVAAWSAMYISSLLEKLGSQKAELEKLATHDNLTGLPNRMLLMDRVAQSIQFSKREKHQFALCFIDLNKFKFINDTLGHKCGDKVLQIVAKRLLETVRKSDTVARLGGDELAVVLNKTDRQGAEIAVGKIIEAIEKPMKFNKKYYDISASIGIAIFPNHGQNANALIKMADDAMYYAKKNGLNYKHVDDIPAEEFTPSEFHNSEFDVTVPKPFS